MKFGETSVGSVDALVNTTQIMRDAKRDWDRVVIVISAMSGVTNLLLDSAASASQGMVDSLLDAESTLRGKHFSAADALIKDEKLRKGTKVEIDVLIFSLVNLCMTIAVLGEASPRALDAMASLGEKMSVRLQIAVVNDAGINAEAIMSSGFVVTNEHYQNAHPDFKVTTEKTRAVLNPLMDEGIIPIQLALSTQLRKGSSPRSAAVAATIPPPSSPPSSLPTMCGSGRMWTGL